MRKKRNFNSFGVFRKSITIVYKYGFECSVQRIIFWMNRQTRVPTMTEQKEKLK